MSINHLATLISNEFLVSIKNKKIDKNWYYNFINISNDEETKIKLQKRIKHIKQKFLDILRKKISRVAKLGKEIPTNFSGIMVLFKDFDEVYVCPDYFWNGQKRMKFDNNSPSRSFLKLEEVFYLLNKRPEKGEIVFDIGAAPGGWSYSASKKGAIVFAIDNGPLKKGALNNNNIIHLKMDGFKVNPYNILNNYFLNNNNLKKHNVKKNKNHPVDWLLCDMIEKPEKVLTLIEKWVNNKWSKYFIVNIKFGQSSPVKLLEYIRKKFYLNNILIKHLYHDREEFTIIGSTLNSFKF